MSKKWPSDSSQVASTAAQLVPYVSSGGLGGQDKRLCPMERKGWIIMCEFCRRLYSYLKLSWQNVNDLLEQVTPRVQQRNSPATSSPPQLSSNYCFYTTILTWLTPTPPIFSKRRLQYVANEKLFSHYHRRVEITTSRLILFSVTKRLSPIKNNLFSGSRGVIRIGRCSSGSSSL